MAKIKRHARYNRFGFFDAVLYFCIILFCACIVLPFLHIIAVSLSANKYVLLNQVSFLPKGLTLDTYRYILRDGTFLNAYKNTLIVTVTGTVLSLTVTAMCAYALSRRAIVGHKFFSIMITITMFFGGGLIPTYLAVESYGLVDSRWAMILPSLINTWNMIIMRSFFIAYPSEIIESGQLDGLQDAGVFFRLVLPTSKAALATIGLYYAVAYWNSYMSARIYIRDQALYPVQSLLQRMIQQAMQETEVEEVHISSSVRYASIMVVVLPIMCVYPFIQKYFVKGVMVGSVKG